MAYNGWKNKETWLVNLWIGDYFAELQEEGTLITRDFVKETVEEYCQGAMGNDVESAFVVDLLNCALGKIDYLEIANHYVEE